MKVNIHGIIGIVAISLMIGVAFILHWDIVWWYFVVAVVLYSIAIIVITIVDKEEVTDDAGHFASLQVLVGCHLAFIFLAGGLLLRLDNFFVQVGVFIAAIAGGLAIPFMLLRYEP